MAGETEKPLCITHTERIGRLMGDTTEQWIHINKLEEVMRKLVPVWTTIVLMVMSGLTGSALTFAGMIIKFSGAK